MFKNPFYIFGAGGFSREVAQLINDLESDTFVTNFVDLYSDKDNLIISQDQFFYKFTDGIGNDYHFGKNKKRAACHFALGVGNSKIREKIASKLLEVLTDNKMIKDVDYYFPRLIHPTSELMGIKNYMKNQFISMYEDMHYNNIGDIGLGTIIAANCVITSDVRIGDFCQVNLGCSIGHDSILGKYVTMSPGTRLSGNTKVGNHVFFGTNSCTVEGVKIADGTIIGAGAVVTKDIIEKDGTWVGIPAKRIK